MVLVIILIGLAITGRVDTALVAAAILALSNGRVCPLACGLDLKLLFLSELLLVEVLVMVVAFEILFELVLVQQLHVRLYLLIVLIFPVSVRVICVEIVLVGRNERRWVLTLHQIIPREVSQPRMVLDVLWAI